MSIKHAVTANCLQGKSVRITINDVTTGLVYGEVGDCVWDDGAAEVIVKFSRKMPDQGFPTGLGENTTWVSRTIIEVV